MSFAESWKSLGNNAYKEGDFENAIKHYSQAIEAEPGYAKYYVNRSLAYYALLKWRESAIDAQKAITIDPKYVKAHYRFIKALFELKRFKDIRGALHLAFSECGEQVKELKELEQELFHVTKIPLRPKSTDFEVIGELGDGNFTKVYKAFLKSTRQIFAIKTIEKTVVDKMKRRHPNISNEILMEKKVLNKLSHPGVVTLYATFQDYGTLYYLMEYLSGGDLWLSLHDILYAKKKNSTTNDSKSSSSGLSLEEMDLQEHHVARDTSRGETGHQIGLGQGTGWSTVRFYFAQLLSAVEYIHQQGIVHRDLKPENIMLCCRPAETASSTTSSTTSSTSTSTSHNYGGYLLKIIDFGTAKDLVDPSLNGPEFVGTADYLCPETVTVHGPRATIGREADLWAMGVILYQMVLGSLPYSSASPFLTMLRIKAAGRGQGPGHHGLPAWLPTEVREMLEILLHPSTEQRLARSTTWNTAVEKEPSSLSYRPLFVLPFFRCWYRRAGREQVAAYWPGGSNTAELGQVLTWYDQRIEGARGVAEEEVDEEDLLSTHPERVYDLLSLDTTTFHPPSNHPNELAQPVAVEEEEAVITTPALLFAHRIPTLHDLCLRAVGDTCIYLQEMISNDYGGLRPKHIPWIAAFSPAQRLSASDRARIMHYLDRQEKLSLPIIFRFFFSSLPEARCLRASLDWREEYTGFSRSLRGHYHNDHHFFILYPPPLPAAITGLEEAVEQSLKTIIATINKLRPRYLMVMMGSSATATVEAAAVDQQQQQQQQENIDRFRKVIARVSDTIPVLFCIGGGHSHQQHGHRHRLLYEKNFGADYYGFWYEGMRGIVLNSSLFFDDEKEEQEHRQAQEYFLQQELEQAKLCSTSILIFSYHPWFYHDIDEEDEVDNNDVSKPRAIPKMIRKKYLQMMQHHKVRYLISAVNRLNGEEATAGTTTAALRPFPNAKVAASEDTDAEEDDDEKEKNEKESEDKKEAAEGKDEGEGEDGKSKNKKKKKDKDEDEDKFTNIEDHCHGPQLLFRPSSCLPPFPSTSQDNNSASLPPPPPSSADTSTPLLRAFFVKENETVEKVYHHLQPGELSDHDDPSKVIKSMQELCDDLYSLTNDYKMKETKKPMKSFY